MTLSLLPPKEGRYFPALITLENKPLTYIGDCPTCGIPFVVAGEYAEKEDICGCGAKLWIPKVEQ